MSDREHVVLLAGCCDTTNIVCNALKGEFPFARVILEEGVAKTQLVRRRVQRLGVRKVAGQLAFQLGVAPALAALSKGRIREILAENHLDLAPPEERVVTRVHSVNDAATIALLREIDPAVVIINGTRILSKALLEAVPTIFLNTHMGITPRYRGVHGGYWALVQRKPDACGVTVHVVDAGIDTGGIVAQALIHPSPRDNFATYPYLQIAKALPLLKRAVRDALGKRLQTVSVKRDGSRLWYHPTLGEYLWHRIAHHVK